MESQPPPPTGPPSRPRPPSTVYVQTVPPHPTSPPVKSGMSTSGVVALISVGIFGLLFVGFILSAISVGNTASENVASTDTQKEEVSVQSEPPPGPTPLTEPSGSERTPSPNPKNEKMTLSEVESTIRQISQEELDVVCQVHMLDDSMIWDGVKVALKQDGVTKKTFVKALDNVCGFETRSNEALREIGRRAAETRVIQGLPRSIHSCESLKSREAMEFWTFGWNSTLGLVPGEIYDGEWAAISAKEARIILKEACSY